MIVHLIKKLKVRVDIEFHVNSKNIDTLRFRTKLRTRLRLKALIQA